MWWLRLIVLGLALGGISVTSLALTITTGISENLFLVSSAASALSMWTGIFLAMRKH